MTASVPKIVIAMPTYNNIGSVGSMIESLSAIDLPLLVIDDGSNYEIETYLPSRSKHTVHLVKHTTNLGKGAALRTAFEWARDHGFSHVLTVDADGQHFADDVRKIADKSKQSPRALILGRRDMDSPSAGHVPGSSKFGRAFSDFWIALESGQRVHDSQSGLRCYPMEGLPDNECWSVRYDFEVEIMTRWLWRRGDVVCQDIAVHYPKNRVSSFRPFMDNARLTRLHTTLCVLRIIGAGWLFSKEKKPNKEVAGAGLLNTLMRAIGPGFCYALLPLVALFYGLIARDARHHLATFYRRLGVRGMGLRLKPFSNISAFAYSIVDRVAFACGVATPMIDSERQRFVASDGGWVILGSHFGDWSFAGSTFAGKTGRRVLVAINQTISQKLQTVVQHAFGNHLSFVDLSANNVGTVLACKETLEQDGYVCLMADRLPPHPTDCLQVTFLGEVAYLPKSVFRLAKAFGRPVKFFHCTRKSFSRSVQYHLVGTTLWDGKEVITEQVIADRYMTELEAAVKKNPQHWFNFHDFWSHPYVNQSSSEFERSRQLPAHA